MIRIFHLLLTANLCGYVLSDSNDDSDDIYSDCILRAIELLDGLVNSKYYFGDPINDAESFRSSYFDLKEYCEQALQKYREENDLFKSNLEVTLSQTNIFMKEVDQKLTNISEYILAQSNRIENNPNDEIKRSRRTRGKFVGCYPAIEHSCGLRVYASEPSQSITVDSCIQICRNANYVYAGLQSGSFCSCGNTIQCPIENYKVSESSCNQTCLGNETQNCGAVEKNAIYETGIEQYLIDEDGQELPDSYITPITPTLSDIRTTPGTTAATPTVATIAIATTPAVTPVTNSILTANRDKVNEFFTYAITGSTSGSLYGTTIYTNDSDLATAAVHSGFVQNNMASTIVVQILPGQSVYTSSTKNGITSKSYGASSGSYCIISATPTSPPVSAPEDLKAYRDKVNDIFIFAITGSISGSIYGTTIYTDDSDLATAAVHSGYVENNMASTILVQILPSQSSYNSTTRNGITSKGYGSWGGSYSIIGAAA